MPTILVIDDEAAICFAFKRFFQKRGYQVLTCDAPDAALELARAHRPFIVFLDVKLGAHDGLSLLPQVREASPKAQVVVVTAFGSLEIVQRAFDLGADEYLTKPLDMSDAERLVRQAASTSTLDSQGTPKPEAGYVGSSAAMQLLFKKLLRIASLDEPVLITGPTGTGKELAAKMIHRKSVRNSGPFVPVNCGALPENLLESELFGHVKGAFTGALEDRTGYCQAAHHGILFLDEIGELPLLAQVKLLRFLDSQTIEKVGAVTPHKVNVRVLAATNVNLEDAVAKGSFRADLYYRLAVLQVHTPALAEHDEDIPELARHFLHQVNPQLTFDSEALDVLRQRTWPGNVRQLKNAVIQASLEAKGSVVTADCIAEEQRMPGTMGNALQAFVNGVPLDGTAMDTAVRQVQQTLIQRALKESGGNQTMAAAKLGVHRNSLHRLLEERDED